jgi:hypothetical protein
MRAPSTYGGSAANNSATSYDCAAAVNSGAATAILIVRITIAVASHDCSAADNGPAAYNRSPAIDRTMPNRGPSVDATASDGSSLSLESVALIHRYIFVRKDRIRGTDCWQDK